MRGDTPGLLVFRALCSLPTAVGFQLGDGCCSCISCSTVQGGQCFAVMVGAGDELRGPLEWWVLVVRAGARVMMGTDSGARPAAASRERKQPKAAPVPVGRRGGAGSWNKSQEGLPGSSWSGLQRMEAGNGKGEGGRGMRRGFLRPRPCSSCAGGPGTSATLAQQCRADMGGWKLCVASGVTCGWHWERGSGWSPTPASLGALVTGGGPA